MQKRLMTDGTVISRAKSPHGVGHVYYVDGGPEGLVPVFDTYMNPLAVILACAAWETDKENLAEFKLNDPKPVFNKTGFRY